MLQHTLRCIELPGVDHTSEVLQEIGKKIKEGQGKLKKGTKAQKVKKSYHSMPCACIHYGRIFMCMIIDTGSNRSKHQSPCIAYEILVIRV